MDASVAREMIALIRAERDRRLKALRNDDSDYADEQWMFTDEPFINELCLLVLVAIRHFAERELVRLGARVAGDGQPLGSKEYWHRVAKERELLRRRDGWVNLAAKLKLTSFSDWTTWLETLRLLANNYKHSAGYGEPEDALLNHLGLNRVISRRPRVTYASLPESRHFREALAQSCSLAADSDYCAIADEILSRLERFLAAVARQPHVSEIRGEPVSLTAFVG